MEHFLHVCPPLSFFAGVERFLAWHTYIPPALGLWVSCHLSHVCFIVCSYVFIIAKEITILVVYAVVAQVTVIYHLQHPWPYCSMESLIFIQTFWPYCYDTAITSLALLTRTHGIKKRLYVFWATWLQILLLQVVMKLKLQFLILMV